MGMAKCGDCLHFQTCSHYVTAEETFPEVGGCSAFKNKGDFVEVVRCKDCKHYDNSEGICWCKLNSKFFPGGLDWHGFPEDGFCSYGERKDNETV